MELKHESDISITEVGQLFLTETCHIGIVDLYRTGIRTVQGTDNLQEGSLASTAGTDDTHNLTLVDVQVDAFQHL